MVGAFGCARARVQVQVQVLSTGILSGGLRILQFNEQFSHFLQLCPGYFPLSESN